MPKKRPPSKQEDSIQSRELRSFKRRLEILSFIRQSRLPVETGDIIQHIQDKGLLDSENKANANRMINRDLNELSDNKQEGNEFGLYCSRGDRNSWVWWIEDIGSQWNTDVKSMPQEVALALTLAEKHLQKNMPTTTFRVLQNHVENARGKILASAGKVDRKNLLRLINRVEISQRGQRLMDPSKLDMNILNTLYDALAKNRTIHIHYGEKQHTLHPAGIVIQPPKIYLIAKSEKYLDKPGYAHFLVHRILKAAAGLDEAKIDADFSLAEYIEQGNMMLPVNSGDKRVYKLKVEIDARNAPNLIEDIRETPIQKTLTIHEEKTPGLYTLSITSIWTVQLRDWLLSLGSHATVISPETVKKDLAAHLRQMLANYP